LGDLSGVKVLDLGCGGGENAVAMARAGAEVVALDISARQMARAVRMAASAAVKIEWRCGDMDDPMPWEGLRIDLVLSAYALPYSHHPDEVLARCHAALRPGGALVIALDHPLRSCFWDAEEGEVGVIPQRSYWDETPLAWRINDTPVMYAHRTTADWIALLQGTGFRLARLLEPQAPQAIQDDCWPEDSALAPLRTIPHTLIMQAVRVEGDGSAPTHTA
jgi:SAM-dependent methyltransferase